MGNVNLPTPVAFAGGALCLLGGYLVGVVAGPESPGQTTAQVQSYDNGTQQLCLTGDSIGDQPGADEGELCGLWRKAARDTLPSEGDDFRFVSIVSTSGDNSATYIYGGVVE